MACRREEGVRLVRVREEREEGVREVREACEVQVRDVQEREVLRVRVQGGGRAHTQALLQASAERDQPLGGEVTIHS